MNTRKLLTRPVPAAAPGGPQPQPRPAALVYTILRHGRGLDPAEAARQLDTLLPEPPPRAA